MTRKLNCWIVLVYGFLQVFLGGYGYINKGSIASLAAGCGLGILLIFSSLAMFQGKKGAAILATLLTAILTFTFIFRYLATDKELPAVLATLSGALLLYLLAQSVRWRK